MAIGWWVAGIVLATLVLVVVFQFNRMVVLRNRCRESWANVDTELRRRHELIPNLVATVQGYMAHERQVLALMVQARASALAARSRTERDAREGAIAQALDRIFAVAEAYPQLRASRNFLALQEELAITEDRIQASRRFYNANVRDYRDATRQFPGMIFANLFGFSAIPFFEVTAAHVRAPVPVAFVRAGAA